MVDVLLSRHGVLLLMFKDLTYRQLERLTLTVAEAGSEHTEVDLKLTFYF